MNDDGRLDYDVVGVQLNAYLDPGRGWVLVVHRRREGGRWAETSRYQQLIRPELLDVAVAELVARLEL